MHFEELNCLELRTANFRESTDKKLRSQTADFRAALLFWSYCICLHLIILCDTVVAEGLGTIEMENGLVASVTTLL